VTKDEKRTKSKVTKLIGLKRAQRDSAEKTSQMRPDGIRRQAKVSLSLACQLVGAGVVPAAPVIAPPPAPAASRINWAISSGCATYDE
jgi:hypothetical protein